MKNYVAYYRVSTEDQGNSGLGLESQQNYVRDFVCRNGNLIGEYSDIVSGKSNTRFGFDKAIKDCKAGNYTLIGYDVTRISRGGFRMMADLEDLGVEYVAAIHPNESSLSKNISFVVGKDYVDQISRNTKKALNVIKKKLKKEGSYVTKSGKVITKLGSPAPISRKAIEKGAEVRRKRAFEHPENVKAGAFIKALRDAGKTYAVIAKSLNEAGFKTSMGNNFSKMQVKRLYERYL